jgi:hypothetical protein
MKKTIFIMTSVVIILALALTGCSFSVSTANVKEAYMTSGADDQGKPLDQVTSYATDAPKLVVAGVLRNAPEETKVKFVWYFTTGGEQKIYEYTMDNQGKSDIYVFGTLESENPWPTGDYRVDIFVDQRDKPDSSVTFKVQ